MVLFTRKIWYTLLSNQCSYLHGRYDYIIMWSCHHYYTECLIVHIICQNITVPNITTETYTKYNNIHYCRTSGPIYTENMIYTIVGPVVLFTRKIWYTLLSNQWSYLHGRYDIHYCRTSGPIYMEDMIYTIVDLTNLVWCHHH